MSHYRLQQTLDTAPSMSQNSIAKLLMTTDESNSGAKVHVGEGDNDDLEAPSNQTNEAEFEILEETIPYTYVTECL